MQKIISGLSVKQLDADYINRKGISSHELMEQAALVFCEWYCCRFGVEKRLAVFCGTGNNGGDGLAISRLLWNKGYAVETYIMGDPAKASIDFKKNLDLLPKHLPVNQVEQPFVFSDEFEVIIDGVLGVGINRPLSGDFLELIKCLNALPGEKIAIDIPTGLPADEIAFGEAFKADYTLSFQFPKLSLLLPENAVYSGSMVVGDIGIEEVFFASFNSKQYYVGMADIMERHKTFHRFSHKGDFGKVLLAGGSFGKMGAIRMASEAALRSGSGLVSAFIPRCGVDVIQVSLPEAMVESSGQDHYLDEYLPDKIQRFDAVGVGPGMGRHPHSALFLEELLKNYRGPMVIDADGINILAENPRCLSWLRSNVVITPHLKEFERLVGPSENHIDRLGKAVEFSQKYGCVVVLKGAHSVISLPSGKQYFNSTGDQSLATGGSGDVLTGMLTSFLGQGYAVEDAAVCAVYHHGWAGELAGEQNHRGTMATDIIHWIPKTFLLLGLKS